MTFDFDAAFVELRGVWRIPGNESEDRMLFDSLVNDTCDDAAAVFADVLDQVKADRAAGVMKTVPFGGYLKRKFGARSRQTSPRPIVTTSEPVAIKPTSTASPFASIFARWPRGGAGLREEVTVAKFEWDRAVTRHGLQVVVDACELYIAKSADHPQPCYMSTWLRDQNLVSRAAEYRETLPPPPEALVLQWARARHLILRNDPAPMTMDELENLRRLEQAQREQDRRDVHLASIRDAQMTSFPEVEIRDAEKALAALDRELLAIDAAGIDHRIEVASQAARTRVYGDLAPNVEV